MTGVQELVIKVENSVLWWITPFHFCFQNHKHLIGPVSNEKETSENRFLFRITDSAPGKAVAPVGPDDEV
jgi:hypothetical protein